MFAEIATEIVTTFPELHVSVLPRNNGCLHFPQGPKLAQGNCKFAKLAQDGSNWFCKECIVRCDNIWHAMISRSWSPWFRWHCTRWSSTGSSGRDQTRFQALQAQDCQNYSLRFVEHFSFTSYKNFNWIFALSHFVDTNNEFQESLEDYFDHVHTDGELWI